MKAKITLANGTVVELEGTPAEIREAMPVDAPPVAPAPPAITWTQAPAPAPVDFPQRVEVWCNASVDEIGRSAERARRAAARRFGAEG